MLVAITRVASSVDFSLLNKTLVEFDQIARRGAVESYLQIAYTFTSKTNDLLGIYRVPINLEASRVKSWLLFVVDREKH